MNLQSSSVKKHTVNLGQTVEAEQHTFVLIASTFDLNFLLFLPLQPVLNSAKVVSAVNECLVPLLDSNTNPGKSSFKMVAC